MFSDPGIDNCNEVQSEGDEDNTEIENDDNCNIKLRIRRLTRHLSSSIKGMDLRRKRKCKKKFFEISGISPLSLHRLCGNSYV